MAFLAALAPYLTAGAALYQGVQQKNAADYNAKVTQGEANLSIDQANAQEGIVRRSSRYALGAQEAAFGASGAGYGGSSETALDQSAVNQELDALNTRYKGRTVAYGYGVQSGLDKKEGQNAAVQGGLMAGAALLKGTSSSYNYYPGTPGGGT